MIALRTASAVFWMFISGDCVKSLINPLQENCIKRWNIQICHPAMVLSRILGSWLECFFLCSVWMFGGPGLQIQHAIWADNHNLAEGANWIGMMFGAMMHLPQLKDWYPLSVHWDLYSVLHVLRTASAVSWKFMWKECANSLRQPSKEIVWRGGPSDFSNASTSSSQNPPILLGLQQA